MPGAFVLADGYFGTVVVTAHRHGEMDMAENQRPYGGVFGGPDQEPEDAQVRP